MHYENSIVLLLKSISEAFRDVCVINLISVSNLCLYDKELICQLFT